MNLVTNLHILLTGSFRPLKRSSKGAIFLTVGKSERTWFIFLFLIRAVKQMQRTDLISTWKKSSSFTVMVGRCDVAPENTFTLYTRGGLTSQRALNHTTDQLSAYVNASVCLQSSSLRGHTLIIWAASLKWGFVPHGPIKSAYCLNSLSDDRFI